MTKVEMLNAMHKKMEGMSKKDSIPQCNGDDDEGKKGGHLPSEKNERKSKTILMKL